MPAECQSAAAPADVWRTAQGGAALWRFVYHAGDLDTASFPSQYVQRHPSLADLKKAPGYPIQALASDGELHHAICAGRQSGAGVFRVVESW